MPSVVRITTKIPSHTITAGCCRRCRRENVFSISNTRPLVNSAFSPSVSPADNDGHAVCHIAEGRIDVRGLSPPRVSDLYMRARARVSWDRHDGETRQLFHVEKKLHRRKEGDKEKKRDELPAPAIYRPRSDENSLLFTILLNP